jgi:hypothetical protein
MNNQSLIGSVVIDVEFDRKNYGSISRKYDREELESLNVRTDSRIRFNCGEKQIK